MPANVQTYKSPSLRQFTHFEPSAVKIGSGVKAVGDGKNKRGQSLKGKEKILTKRTKVLYFTPV